jgi:cytochrome c peroxidase
MLIPRVARMSLANSCAAVLALALGIYSAGSSLAAVVGAPKTVEIAKASDLSAQDLRAAFRRPASIPFPKDNLYTIAKAELGKKLYFDTRLSAANVLSCATCHNPGFGWGDGQPLGTGHGMNTLGRRSPTIINAAFGQIFMWDSRFASLEQQALGPIESEAEMHLPLDQLLARLNAIPEYQSLFSAAFPGEPINSKNLGKAIATYERTVVSGRAPFDAWIEGDDKAISKEAQQGFELFNTKAKCSACHNGWTFTDDSTHDIGLPGSDIGRGKFLPDVEKMQFAFKTPGLREIARRAPYMHDGSLPTLEAVIEHYDSGGINRKSRSDAITPLGLTAQEKASLVAFLKTLTSDVDPTIVPALPR